MSLSNLHWTFSTYKCDSVTNVCIFAALPKFALGTNEATE